MDAAYATHPDMKGHTGATFTMGQGSIYNNSLKQKLVARSSTEAELVGMHDILPQILWTRNFLMSQGYPVQKNILYQDNMSTMLLENNGRKSSTKRTKHIELRYFFIHDQIKKDKVLIEHCPTLKMRGDFFTKPLQGMLFYRLRDLIMNIAPESPYHSSHRSVLQDTGKDAINPMTTQRAQQKKQKPHRGHVSEYKRQVHRSMVPMILSKMGFRTHRTNIVSLTRLLPLRVYSTTATATATTTINHDETIAGECMQVNCCIMCVCNHNNNATTTTGQQQRRRDDNNNDTTTTTKQKTTTNNTTKKTTTAATKQTTKQPNNNKTTRTTKQQQNPIDNQTTTKPHRQQPQQPQQHDTTITNETTTI